jgi:hypothetical protein
MMLALFCRRLEELASHGEERVLDSRFRQPHPLFRRGVRTSTPLVDP